MSREELGGSSCLRGEFKTIPHHLRRRASPTVLRGLPFSWLKLHHLSSLKPAFLVQIPAPPFPVYLKDFVSSTIQWLVVLKDLREPFLSAAGTAACGSGRPVLQPAEPPTLTLGIGAALQSCWELTRLLRVCFEPQWKQWPPPCTGLWWRLSGAFRTEPGTREASTNTS